MSEIICVTDPGLCREGIEKRLELIAAARPAAVILRAKTLSAAGYRALAEKARDICEKHGVKLILHGFVDEALALGHDAVHLPLPELRKLDSSTKKRFDIIGASCHSVEDALEAQSLGCRYIVAGHIFDTDCKKGIPARGLDFLSSVCRAADIPVYAIGGITPANLPSVLERGAAGACVMSALMTRDDPGKYLEELKNV